MMSHWSALIIRVSYCKIVCLNYLEAEDWKTSQKEYLFYQLMIKKFSLKMSINLLNCKTERIVELSIV